MQSPLYKPTMNMNKVSLLLLILGVHATLSEKAYDAMRDQSLHLQDGIGWFRGYSFNNRSSKDMENPCERWKFSIRRDGRPQVMVIGCGPVRLSARYTPEVEQKQGNAFRKCCSAK
uniref:Secreted protein n=1 Tax=Amblyomma cajennense TaxID=34607 RepID=A0A023FFY7_AMBCJ